MSDDLKDEEAILRRRLEQLAAERLRAELAALEPVPEGDPYRGDGIADLRRERDQARADLRAALKRAEEATALTAKWRGRAGTWENLMAVMCLLFVLAALGFLGAFRGYLTQDRRADLCEEVLRGAGDAGTRR